VSLSVSSFTIGCVAEESGYISVTFYISLLGKVEIASVGLIKLELSHKVDLFLRSNELLQLSAFWHHKDQPQITHLALKSSTVT
jgi:hypothetical protein